MNALKIGFLLVAMTVLMVAVGGLLKGSVGMVFAFGLALIMNGTSYWFSDRIVLKMYKAQPISESEAPELHTIVQRLTREAGIPMPKLYIIPGSMPNAFATGRNPSHAAVAVTEGLLRILDREEVEGVLAHELAHVKNRDILIGSIAATMAGAIMLLASIARWGMILGGRGGRDSGGAIGMLVAVIVAPIAAMMIQMAISRSREYQADATGAAMCRSPLGLANALTKLENASHYSRQEVNPSTAHMFIVNPLKGGGIAGLFSTHPPIPDRVSRLRTMADKMGRI